MKVGCRSTGGFKSISTIKDIQNDIAKKASKKSEVNNVAIVELITASSKLELLEKCEKF
jgi:hypothetical protein